jgi:hypothetical protein
VKIDLENNKNIPDFFIVGAAKSGTSAMHHFLRQHPQIFMPEMKEIHHFCPDLLERNDPWLNPDKYYSVFENAGEKQLIGETSVFYLLSKTAAVNIKQAKPEARIIIMIRNPVEVMYALHAQLVYNNEEDILDFEKAILAEEARKRGLNLPELTRIQQKHRYHHVVCFSDHITRFMEVFPKDAIHIIIYDDFKCHTLQEVQKTYKFLGVDDAFEPEIKMVNANKKLRSRKFGRLHQRMIYHIFSRILNEKKLGEINDFFLKVN